MEQDNRKIVMMVYVAAGILMAIVVRVMLETLAAGWGLFARIYDHAWVQHLVPVGVGLIIFLLLQFNKKITTWANEVIVELRKVVFPSQKDTMAMAIVTSVMVLTSGIILGLFDFISRTVVKFILN